MTRVRFSQAAPSSSKTRVNALVFYIKTRVNALMLGKLIW